MEAKMVDIGVGLGCAVDVGFLEFKVIRWDWSPKDRKSNRGKIDVCEHINEVGLKIRKLG